MISNEINDWLKERPKWIQSAADYYIKFGVFDDESIDRFATLCLEEADNKLSDIHYEFPNNAFATDEHEPIRLNSIGNITGVNMLSPQKPLSFGSSNIAIVYGNNGSGKSGYVRLLKHICGTRECSRGNLHNNVFTADPIKQTANISYTVGQSCLDFVWNGEELSEDLSAVEIFDTSFGGVFIGSENEVCYEPPLLLFLSTLVNLCEKVANSLENRASTLISKIPLVPLKYSDSFAAQCLKNIKATTPMNEIDEFCNFTAEEAEQLRHLQDRLIEKSPADKAEELQKKMVHLEQIIALINTYSTCFSDEVSAQLSEKKHFVQVKKQAADAAASDAFSNVRLEGVASEIWLELWESARKYSQKIAYKDLEFPVVQKDAICVLCQQPLSKEAEERFISFESYVRGETQKEAESTRKDLKDTIEAFPKIISIEEMMTRADAADIKNQSLRNDLTCLLKSFQERKAILEVTDGEAKLNALFPMQPLIDELKKIVGEYEKLKENYLEDAKGENRADIESKVKILESKKWLQEQKPAVIEEVTRLTKLERIQEAKRKTNTTSLSRKKGELSELLITEAFVTRFNNELNYLGCSRIKVKLIKSKVIKGKVYHTLQLDGAVHHQNQLDEILSEGENRIISIASFLADVCGKTSLAPIVFDDPISSLDQEFEEAVVRRLCEMAKQRQVIIFTHRLSLLGLLQEYASKLNISPEVICVRKESWGTGEPGDTPIFAKKPDKALNKLINERIPIAKKLLAEHGTEVYESYAKGLCSDFRILLERMIESELMGDVVQRYRRDVTTKNKIFNLAKIQNSDCQYFDDMMTKYSRFEHSQPLEAPIPLPKPDEIESDFQSLRTWFEEFKGR